MQMAEKYLGSFKVKKLKTPREYEGLPTVVPQFAERVEITRAITDYTTTVMNDIYTLTLNELVGKRKRRNRSRYDR